MELQNIHELTLIYLSIDLVSLLYFMAYQPPLII